MQITETLNEGLKRELKVVIPADSLNSKLNERLQTLSRQVRIKGFRPGKVPAEHLRKVYGRSVLAEIIQESVRESAEKAVTDRNEKPALQPKINFSEDEKEIEAVMSGNADLAYTMEFEVIPEFEKPDLGAIELEKRVSSASDEDIDDALARIVEQNQSFEPRDKSAPAENGDRVTIDYVGKVDGARSPAAPRKARTSCWARTRSFPASRNSLSARRPATRSR